MDEHSSALTIRFPDALRQRLEKSAKRNGRSLNREVVSVLEASAVVGAFRQRLQTDAPPATRDSAILDLLVGGRRENAKLIRRIVFAIQSAPGWQGDSEQRRELADKVHALILHGDAISEITKGADS